MVMIASPKLPLGHPARARACEDAMQTDNFRLLDRGRAASCDDFQALAKRAQAAGWLPEEIAAAMVSLGSKYVQARSPAHACGHGEIGSPKQDQIPGE
jgi:hypothetical protein